MPLPPELIARLADCANHDFVGTRDGWLSALSWSTRIVALGLVLELPELAYELLDIARKRLHRFQYKIVLLEHWLEISKAVAFIGWFLIVIGVAGEGYIGDRVNVLNASIQVCSDAKVTEATLNAGDAAESAKSAHAELTAIKLQASALQSQLSDTETRLAEVSKGTEALARKEQGAENALGFQQEVSRQLVLRVVQRHILDRSLFPALKRFPSPPTIDIQFKDGDAEAFMFARDIEAAINESGWTKASLPHPRPSNEYPLWGCHVSARSVLATWNEQQEEFKAPTRPAYALAKAIGWDCTVAQDTGLGDNQFRVVIGEHQK